MGIKYVLFDLDGTLLPMDQNAFVAAYFGGIAKHLAPHGYESNQLIDTIWRGTAAMVKNDGKRKNEDAFWELFSEVYGVERLQDMALFEEFYRKHFDAVSSSCGYDPAAAETVRKIKGMGYIVVLATNPIFPAIATEKRMRWAGLHPSDFSFYTTYENARFCKPNPAYYQDILEKLGAEASECLMVGNDVDEDMVAASSIGMKVFLLPKCLLNKHEIDTTVYPQGDFVSLLDFLQEQARKEGE